MTRTPPEPDPSPRQQAQPEPGFSPVRRQAAAEIIDKSQIEAAAEAYYAYCDAEWTHLDPKAQALYLTRMQLALTAYAQRIWRTIDTVPRDGCAVLLYQNMDGRGDYIWLDRWDYQDRRWRLAPHGAPTHWMPIPPPPHT